ncbi:MAG: UDP-N-acetylglucosamine 2-epimerase, partial [Thiomonas sp.]
APREAALRALQAALTQQSPHLSPPHAVGGRALRDDRPYVLALFHPVVQEADDAAAQTQALIDGLRAAGAGSAFRVVWLAPNADAGSGHIEALLRAQQWPGFHRITHLPRADYLAALRHAVVLVGNSSSGIIEAASAKTDPRRPDDPTVVAIF